MTNRERVLMALQHKQPDKTPFNIGFTHFAYKKMAEYWGDPDFQGKLDNCMATMGTTRAGGWKEIRPDIWEDEFGVQWDRSIDKDIGVVCNCLVTPDNLAHFELPDPDDPTRYSDYDRFIGDHQDRFLIADLGFSFFERAWTLTGMEALLIAMVNDADFVHRLLDRILAYNLRVIEHACRHNIDAMMFGDDWGQQRGLIMGPELWRTFIKPRLREMYQLVKSHHKAVVIHSCGKVDEVFPDLIEIGLDMFNPFQPEVMNVYEMKRRYGDKLAFFGGVSTQKTLPFGTVTQVKDEVRRLIDQVGRNGGYVCAPAHAIPGDAKPENIAAMIEVLQDQ
jgi:uroporphyrinogen decarboxylase